LFSIDQLQYFYGENALLENKACIFDATYKFAQKSKNFSKAIVE